MAEAKPQTMANHTRWDPPFHFFVLPIFALGLILTLVHFFAHITQADMRDNIHAFLLILLALALLTLMFKVRLYSIKSAGPRDSPGRAAAADPAAAGTVALAYPRTDGRPALRAAFRVGCRDPKAGRAHLEREVIAGRHQESDPELAAGLLAGVERAGRFRQPGTDWVNKE